VDLSGYFFRSVKLTYTHHTQTRMHAHTCAHADTRTHTHTNTHTQIAHTHTHTHIHTHTHTHTQSRHLTNLKLAILFGVIDIIFPVQCAHIIVKKCLLIKVLG